MMNEVEQFGEISKQSQEEFLSLQSSIRDTYIKLKNVIDFSNRLPDSIIVRKINLQNLIKNTLLDIDSILRELQKISFDCNMQVMDLKRKEFFDMRRHQNEK